MLPLTLNLLRSLDYISYAERRRAASISLHDRTASDCANFFRGLLGANITFADVENYVLNKLERMSQH